MAMPEDDRLLQVFKEIGALWVHDGHPNRPYALLTSDKVSNTFFNVSKIIEQPRLLEDIADDLIMKVRRSIKGGNHDEQPDRFDPDGVLGPATGAITLAYVIASKFPHTRAWFTEPEGEGISKIMKLKRFEPYKPDMWVFVVEDIITTGGSADASVKAILDTDPNAHVYDWVGCIVNRSGHTTTPEGKTIVSLLEVNPKTWERGSNPFVANGGELVEPVRPKANWHVLNRSY